MAALPPADITNGLKAVAIAPSAVEVKPIKGGVQVTTPKAATIAVYTLDGSLYTTCKAQPGTTTLQLPAATYIVEGRKITIRNEE